MLLISDVIVVDIFNIIAIHMRHLYVDRTLNLPNKTSLQHLHVEYFTREKLVENVKHQCLWFCICG